MEGTVTDQQQTIDQLHATISEQRESADSMQLTIIQQNASMDALERSIADYATQIEDLKSINMEMQVGSSPFSSACETGHVLHCTLNSVR